MEQHSDPTRRGGDNRLFGVARGLLHHYFGTKRDLYLEVIRSVVRVPSNPVPLQAPGRGAGRTVDAVPAVTAQVLDDGSGWTTLTTLKPGTYVLRGSLRGGLLR